MKDSKHSRLSQAPLPKGNENVEAETCPQCGKQLIPRQGYPNAENELECPDGHYKRRKSEQSHLQGEATDCSNYPACKHACGDELIKSGCNSDCPYNGVAEPKSSLELACNTPNCPTKKDGMKIMEHPGTNKQVYKCPGCGCEVLIITEQSPHAPIFSEDGGKDARICACCKRTLPEDVEVCFQCIGYNHFEPSDESALPCRSCGNLDWGECEYSSIPIDLKNEDGSCKVWEPIKVESSEEDDEDG